MGSKRKPKPKPAGVAAIAGVVFGGCILMGLAFGMAIGSRLNGLYIGLILGAIGLVLVYWFLDWGTRKKKDKDLF